MKTYKQGVQDCMRIMGDLYDTYGDYSVVRSMYYSFNKRSKQLIENDDARFKKKTIQECLDYLLEDDETETGGISFVGYTLRDFLLEENGGTLDDIIMDADVSSLDVALKMAGIKPIK